MAEGAVPAVEALVGKPSKGDFEAPWSLFGASEGAVEALLAASPGRFRLEFCRLRLFGACTKGIWVLACEPCALVNPT